MKLTELANALETFTITGDAEQEIGGIEYDSRQISSGSVFVAVPGLVVDGYSFARSAVKNGATVVVSERDNQDKLDVTWIKTPNCRQALSDLAAKFYNYPGKALKVCGITGTNGKTTSAFLLKKALEERGKRVGLISSLIYDTGDEQFEAERTTPESLDLQRLLYLMRKNMCQNVVMEVSSHALVMKRVENIDFRVGLFTNITRDHLDYHSDMKAYFEAKATLLNKLDGAYRYSVINLDVPEFRELFGRVRSAYLSYSLENSAADVYTTGFQIGSNETIFDLVAPMVSRTVKLKLVGKFNLINALGVIATGLACGVDVDTIVTGIESVNSVPGRFERIDCGQPFEVVIDYAHTPDAITRVVSAARDVFKGRIIALFGCGGDRDKGKRPLMGQAASAADIVIVTSDNPRTEDPLAIIEDIKPGLSGDFKIVPDRSEALRAAFKLAKEDDAVICLGKGAERYEENSEGKSRYDETSEVAATLAEMGYKKTRET